MRGIRLQRQVHVVPGDLHVGGGAEVVLHVAGSLHVVGLEALAAEFGEQCGQRLLDDVDQRIQPAAMRHADGDLNHAGGRRRLDHRVQRGNGYLAAFQAKALGGDVALLAERLEPLGLGQALQDGALFVSGQERQPGRALDPALDPGFLLRILDVHEFDADRAAIGLPQDLHNLPQCRGFPPEHLVDEDRFVPVGLGEAIGLRVQFSVFEPERSDRADRAGPPGGHALDRSGSASARGAT